MCVKDLQQPWNVEHCVARPAPVMDPQLADKREQHPALLFVARPANDGIEFTAKRVLLGSSPARDASGRLVHHGCSPDQSSFTANQMVPGRRVAITRLWRGGYRCPLQPQLSVVLAWLHAC